MVVAGGGGAVPVVGAGGHEVPVAQQLARQDVKPIDDVRSTAEYRLRVVDNLVAAWLDNTRANR